MTHKTRGATALVLLLLTLSSCKSTADALGIKLKLDQRRLDNGLTVIMVENPKVPVVSYQTWFRVGSVDEQRGSTGLAHLFEHLMFKGTPKYGPKQFFEQLEAKGAEVNAFTTRDYTVYYENFKPDLLPKVIEMESDRLANLTMTDEILETERQVVLEERRLRTDSSPAGKMQEALWELAYQRHPYSWPVIGYPQDLLAINLAKLQSFFKTHYQPSNAAIVIVGNFDADQAFSMIKKAYGEIPSQASPDRKIPNELEQKEERRLELKDHVASEQFAYAYHVTRAEDEDSYALDVLANILFEGGDSRAYRLMVDEKDVVVSISGSAYTPTYPGLFIISGVMKGHLKTDVAENLLNQVIAEIQEKGPSQDEIAIAVKQLTLMLVDSVRTPHGLGQLIGTVHTIFGNAERFARDLEKYQKVKSEDVVRVARKYLDLNNRSVVVIVPETPNVGRKTK